MNWDLFSKRSSKEEQKKSSETEQQIVAQFNGWLPHILKIEKVQTMITFDEAIDYFYSDLPSDPSVKKGVIICQECSGGKLLGQMFLNRKNQLVRRPDGTPYGRQLVTRKLAPELKEKFDNKGLIIVPIADCNQSIFSLFVDELKLFLAQEEVKPILTYKEVIQYFITDRPSNPSVKKGAIIRQPHKKGQELIQFFLDSNNEIVYASNKKPYGRKLVAKQLDDELEDNFGNENLIIVE